MPKVLLTAPMYSPRPLSKAEAATLEAHGIDGIDKLKPAGTVIVHVENQVLDAWHQHCDSTPGLPSHGPNAAVWRTLWSALAKVQHLQRRVLDLLPLQNEVMKLREDLACTQRVFLEELRQNEKLMQNDAGGHPPSMK